MESPNAYIYHNGEIVQMTHHTHEDKSPEAVAILNDRIVALGEVAHCQSAIEAQCNNYELIDLNGQTLLPGFIDAHMHPIPVVFFAMNAILDKVTTFSELKSELQPYVESAEKGEWVVGLQFIPDSLSDVKELTCAELDLISPLTPLVIYMRDGHSIVTNSAAMELAGLGSDVIVPDGGVAEFDSNGLLKGIFRETANALILSHMPLPNMVKMQNSVKSCFMKLASQGITSLGAMLQSDSEGPSGEAGKMEAMAMQILNGDIPQSLYCIIIGKTLEGINAMIQSDLNNRHTHVTRSFKIFADGTLGGCTACMSEPFQDTPDKKGFMTISDDDLYGRMKAAHLAGYQICIHAIGDQSIKQCLDFYEMLLKEHPKEDHRHRLEHASVADELTIKRMAELGIIVAVQPIFIRSEKSWLPKRLGEYRCNHTYPFKSFLDHGVRMAGSSDAPIEDSSVLAAIHCCVTRDGFAPRQCITPYDALKMYTVDAAYAQFQENEKGTIEVGKRADLIVLDRNPLTVPVDEILEIEVMRTIIGGKVIF